MIIMFILTSSNFIYNLLMSYFEQYTTYIRIVNILFDLVFMNLFSNNNIIKQELFVLVLLISSSKIFLNIFNGICKNIIICRNNIKNIYKI